MNKKLLYAIACATLAVVGAWGFHMGVRSQSVSWENDGRGESRAPGRAGEPKEVSAKKPDQVSPAKGAPSPGARFPNTPVGRALDQHLQTLIDISAGADERKERSLVELRKNPKEASQALLAAYHAAHPKDFFGRWLLGLTLSELNSAEAYAGLREIAFSEVPADLKDNDLEGSQRANESAIRQSSVAGLVRLARAGNPSAERDLLSLALNPPSKDDAVRTVAIKGYLAAGRDYEARVQRLKARLPRQYHDVVTLTVSTPEEPPPPSVTAKPRKGRG
jgi:hypothetical protein